MTKKLCLEMKLAGIWNEDMCKFCTVTNCIQRKTEPILKKVTNRNKRFYKVYIPRKDLE
jgi:hypothetical protein